MNSRKSFLTHCVVLLICSVFATGSVFAQDADEEGSNQKTKQAQSRRKMLEKMKPVKKFMTVFRKPRK